VPSFTGRPPQLPAYAPELVDARNSSPLPAVINLKTSHSLPSRQSRSRSRSPTRVVVCSTELARAAPSLPVPHTIGEPQTERLQISHSHSYLPSHDLESRSSNQSPIVRSPRAPTAFSFDQRSCSRTPSPILIATLDRSSIPSPRSSCRHQHQSMIGSDENSHTSSQDPYHVRNRRHSRSPRSPVAVIRRPSGNATSPRSFSKRSSISMGASSVSLASDESTTQDNQQGESQWSPIPSSGEHFDSELLNIVHVHEERETRPTRSRTPRKPSSACLSITLS
jgi:hypothetical protein